MPIVKAITGVLLPPLSVFLDKGPSISLLVNSLLTIFTVWTCGIIHAFHAEGIDMPLNISCLLLPPLGALMTSGWVAFFICLALTLLGWLPGVVYAYYCALKSGKKAAKAKKH